MNVYEGNNTTLQSYGEHLQEYIDGTPQEVNGYVKYWLDTALGYVSKEGVILELGSAFGRDAAYIEKEKGYQVQRSDAIVGFVDILHRQGHNAKIINAITDELGSGYSMVFANAVLLHFTSEETKVVLSKIHRSLTESGVLAFTVKQGQGSEWSEDKLGAPRFFNYWTLEAVDNLLSETGFKPLIIADDNTLIIADDNISHPKTVKWIYVITQKA